MGMALAFLFPHHDINPPGVSDDTKLREKIVQVTDFISVSLFDAYIQVLEAKRKSRCSEWACFCANRSHMVRH